MENTLDLDDLRRQADDENPPITIPLGDSAATLTHWARLPQPVRDTIAVQLLDYDRAAANISRRTHVGAGILKAVAGNAGDQLVEALNGDAVVIDKVLTEWRASIDPTPNPQT